MVIQYNVMQEISCKNLIECELQCMWYFENLVKYLLVICTKRVVANTSHVLNTLKHSNDYLCKPTVNIEENY